MRIGKDIIDKIKARSPKQEMKGNMRQTLKAQKTRAARNMLKRKDKKNINKIITSSSRKTNKN